MSDEAVRLFSREFKLAALARMEAGEKVSALARELGVKRKYLYQWRERFRAGSVLACIGLDVPVHEVAAHRIAYIRNLILAF